MRRPLGVEGLLRTLEDLAGIGDKRAGSPGGHRAAAYLQQRFSALGLQPRLERFHFPRHEVTASTLEVDGRPLACEVLEASAGGSLRAPLADAGRAEAPLARRFQQHAALVERDTLLHRSSQYEQVVAVGGVALILASAAPRNLHQVGSVRRGWEAAGSIPAVTIGAEDARRLRDTLTRGKRLEAALDVAVRILPGVGQNVIARVEGERADQIVIGAHYDTWFTGSTDNGAGVAALVELATRWLGRPRPPVTLVFVAWDGEELALYGGYDFLRRHVIVGRQPVLAVLDLETPSSHGAQAYALAHSSHGAWERALAASDITDLFAFAAPMSMVPELFGGVIPTDIQGLYRAGTPVLSTAGDGPYYHTVEDTPDKVDLHRLAELVDVFDRLLQRMTTESPQRFAGHDSGLWHLDGQLRDSLILDVTVRNGSFSPQPGANVEAVLLHDHFFESATVRGCTDENGRLTLRFAALEATRAPRFVHITAGNKHPLAERIIPLD